jgi:hypothetical protein
VKPVHSTGCLTAGRADLVLGGERALDHPDALRRQWIELEIDASAALRVGHMLDDRALHLDHGGARKLEVDAHDRPERRLRRRLEEHLAATQIAAIDGR